MQLHYRTMAEYMAEIFPGRVQKIAVNASLGCPNRDGTIGTGGCIYCNNASFNPAYANLSKESITKQLEKGVSFFSKKGTPFGYLPYFQSYSNTYGDSETLIELYEEALSFPNVVGLVIATRPDCLSDSLIEYFAERFGNCIQFCAESLRRDLYGRHQSGQGRAAPRSLQGKGPQLLLR